LTPGPAHCNRLERSVSGPGLKPPLWLSKLDTQGFNHQEPVLVCRSWTLRVNYSRW